MIDEPSNSSVRLCLKARTATGFTLIEVLVALFVVATALAALGFAGAQALKDQAVLEERTFALWAADNQLAELRLQRSLQPGTSTGSVHIGNRGWRWRRQVQLAPGGQLWRIDVTILDADAQPIYTHTGFESR